MMRIMACVIVYFFYDGAWYPVFLMDDRKRYIHTMYNL